MHRPMLSIVAGSLLLAGAGVASAQMSTTTSTTTWNSDEGNGLRQYSVTRHYKSYDDPAVHAQIGEALPSGVPVYPLPDTLHVPSAERYSYSIVNNEPVVVERTTRKVVHTWN